MLGAAGPVVTDTLEDRSMLSPHVIFEIHQDEAKAVRAVGG